jgi:hypothetical protein
MLLRETVAVYCENHKVGSRDISLGIAMGYGMHGLGSIPVRPASGAHRPLSPMSTGSDFTRVKLSRREAEHSPPSSAEIKVVKL